MINQFQNAPRCLNRDTSLVDIGGLIVVMVVLKASLPNQSSGVFFQTFQKGSPTRCNQSNSTC